MISDSHVHIGVAKAVNRSVSKKDILNLKKTFLIDHMIVMPSSDNPKETELITELSSDKIHGLYWMTDKPVKFDYLKDNGSIGFKCHGAFTKEPIITPKYTENLTELNRNSGVLLIHCGMHKNGLPESATSWIHCAQVAKQYPRIRVVMAHLGGSITSIVKQACDGIENIKNIWVETSGITTPYAVEYAVERLGKYRVMFGSDYPWCSFKAMRANIEDANISNSTKKLIMEENLIEMLDK